MPKHRSRFTSFMVCLWMVALSCAVMAQIRPPIQLIHRYPASQSPTPFASISLSYYGGPVISNVKVIAVFWTSAVDSGEQSNAAGFYGTVTNSPWMGVMVQYSTTGITGGSNQTIGAGSYAGAVTITPANTSKSLTDANIQTELAAQITAGKLPAPQLDSLGNPDTLYMVYFPLGYSITGPGGSGQSCVTFCAYHGTMSFNSKLVPYGIIPDLSPSSACTGGCGNDANYINNLDSVCSHELAESITDTGVGQASTFAPPLAWYDSSNGEIGDICNAQEATVSGYTVQKLWSNADNACVATRPGVASTVTTVSTSLAQAKFRQAVKLTATVTSLGLAVPSGTVTFKDGATVLASGLPVSTQGKASITISGQRIGRHPITAQYSGNSSYSPSSSSTVNQYRSPKPH